MIIMNRSLTGTVKHICLEDPALDKSDKGFSLEKFRADGDMAHMPCKDGQKPTVFHLKSLSMKRLQKLTSMRQLDGSFSTEQLGEAVTYGLKRVDDMEVDGSRVELKLETVGGEEKVTRESAEAIFSIALFAELGYRILEISDLSF